MSKINLAIKYRPSSFDDLTEQESIKKILTYQCETKTNVNAYLFCGSAGCGKTTSARIFAKMLNDGVENCIELDAASNNSVDDMRKLVEQSNYQDLTSDYKVIILDEVHVLSNQAWQALLKTLEEPPAKTIFIMCTTDPQKIPKTILSRVQRFNFKKISYEGIIDRLLLILECEKMENEAISYDFEAIEYIARLSQGGLRDAITSLDKCLSYSNNLTVEVVEKCLDIVDIDIMAELSLGILNKRLVLLDIIENVYNSGSDIKLFTKQYLDFVVNHIKLIQTKNEKYTLFSKEMSEKLLSQKVDIVTYIELMELLLDLNELMRYETNPKVLLEAYLIKFVKDHKL